MYRRPVSSPTPDLLFFFFNDTATTEIYTLSLHDALPILLAAVDEAAIAKFGRFPWDRRVIAALIDKLDAAGTARSEEHTSELQSHSDLVCRLLLEKKKKKTNTRNI